VSPEALDCRTQNRFAVVPESGCRVADRIAGENSPTIQLTVSELHGDQEQIRMTGHIILIRARRSFNARPTASVGSSARQSGKLAQGSWRVNAKSIANASCFNLD